MRVALTRAVAAGDLTRTDGDYALGSRLRARQRHQDEALDPGARVAWDASWELAVVVVTGRSGADRAALRTALTSARLAEPREGVWTRPANLARPRAYAADPVLTCLRATPDGDPRELSAVLWDLDGWSARTRTLLGELAATTEPASRLAVAAGLVRHLATDPLLPDELLPRDWPGALARATYDAYQAELRDLALG
jgi:phenylacetic acid degradation operon negative regulatory protein